MLDYSNEYVSPSEHVARRDRLWKPASPVVPRERLEPGYAEKLRQQREEAEAARLREQASAAERARLEKEAEEQRRIEAEREAITQMFMRFKLEELSEIRASLEANPTEVLTYRPLAKLIKKQVAEKYGVDISELDGQRRNRTAVLSRQEAMYRMRVETPYSLPQIGKMLGGRDHTTVLHGIRQHAKRNGLPVPGERA